MSIQACALANGCNSLQALDILLHIGSVTGAGIEYLMPDEGAGEAEGEQS